MELAEGLARSFGLDLETVAFTLNCVSACSIVRSTSEDESDYDDSDFLEISFLDTTLRSDIALCHNPILDALHVHINFSQYVGLE